MMKSVMRVALIVAACAVGSSAAQAASVENGRKAFVTHGCWQCHGFEGQGSAVTSNGRVLSRTELPFEAFEGFVRSTNRAMPPYREAILSSSDLADIYAFLQAVPPPKDPSEIPLLK